MAKKTKTKESNAGAVAPVDKVGKIAKRKAPVASEKPVSKAANAAKNSATAEPVKGLKRKKAEKPVAAPGGEGAVPAKKSKGDSGAIIAGTTMEQVGGMNLKKVQAKRAKKRANNVKRLEGEKVKSKDREQEEIKEYLETWTNNREKWKFQKLKQILVQKFILEETKIGSELFPLALEYLSGTKGPNRELLVRTAESVIQKIDSAATENEDDENLQESSKYQRARELLQTFG